MDIKINTGNFDDSNDKVQSNYSDVNQNKNSGKLKKHSIHINRYLVHKPLQYGKKFYLLEFLAERFIKFVAIISIISILAIFYYVFQEATYAFQDPKKIILLQGDNELNSSDNELKQETYNPNEELQQEQYSTDNNTESSELTQETYSLNDAEVQTDSKKEKQILEKPEESVEEVEKKVSIDEFFTPNDYVDNKPEYIWQPISSVPKYSFIPIFWGALKVTLIGIVIAAPIAILAAIFTVAFSPKWLKEILKPAIEILASFPSVVIGFFCLMTLATIVQELFDTTYRLNSFVGGIGMSLAVIPIIYTVTEDALSAVPKFMKEASLALGASRWQTAWRVLLPAAAPGVFAALILGFGRAFGETMIALMATGNAALVSLNLFESVRTMAATIGAEMAEVEFRSIHYGILFLIGAILFVITFTLNAIAEFYVRKKLMKKFQGL